MKIFAAVLISVLSFAHTALAQPSQPEWCSTRPDPKYKTLHRVPLLDTWFEVYEVSQNVFAIYEPRQSEGTIGYLIVGNQRAVLFDTGMGIGDLKKLTSELTTLPIIVLNSHTHGIELPHPRRSRRRQLAVLNHLRHGHRLHASKRERLRRRRASRNQIQRNLRQPARRLRSQDLCHKAVEITKYMRDGDKIDLGGRSLQVIATPGHTPDAICLFDGQRPSLHRRHLLSRHHLALPPGDRPCSLRRLRPPPRCTCPSGQNRPRRPRLSHRSAIDPARPVSRFRSSPRRQDHPSPRRPRQSPLQERRNLISDESERISQPTFYPYV
jgi:hypothetical protein